VTAFVDANVIIHAVGAPAPVREPCREILSLASAATTPLIVSAEVLQELLHVHYRRYGAERAGNVVRLAIATFEVVPVFGADIAAALSFTRCPGLQARDLVHLATMDRLGLTRIISTDRAFDGVAGIERLDTAAFAEWRDTVFPGA
jgi:predicted nucleic acid-binding protein